MRALKLRVKILLVVILIFVISFLVNLFFLDKGLTDMEQNLTQEAEKEMHEIAEKQAIQIGRGLTVMAEGVRENVAQLWRDKIFNAGILVDKLGDPKSEEYKKYLGIIPIVASMRAVRNKTNELGIKFKVPKVKARNKENRPTPEEVLILDELKAKKIPFQMDKKAFDEKIVDELLSERDKTDIMNYYTLSSDQKSYNLKGGLNKEETKKVLDLLRTAGYMDEKVVIDAKSNEIHYYRAVRLTQVCLNCHGDPKTSSEIWGNDEGKDPTGVVMENWKKGEIHGAFKITLSLDKTDKLIQEYSKILKEKGGEDLDKARLSSFGVNIVLIILGILALFFLIRKLLSPMARIVLSLKDIAGGNFRTKLEVGSQDEIGEIATNMNSMQNNLSDTLSKVDEIAGQLATSSEELNATAVTLTDDSQAQAASLEETVASLNEFSEAIKSVQQNSEDMSSQGKQTLKIARDSLKLIEEAVTEMKEINASSEKIVEIVKVINDIADQTNLLSLNAAIEAARAGEHGRGFAVVADEISKLADKSAQSTKIIEHLVKESQDNTIKGTGIVNKAGEAFRDILMNVEKTTENIDFINGVLVQQARGAGQIQTAMNTVNETSQSQSAGLEEMTASFNALSNHAETMKNLMEQFVLSENGNGKTTKLILHNEQDQTAVVEEEKGN